MPSVMSLPSVWHSAKPSLPSVDSLPSVLGLALGKECLCRVSDIWHSAKELALGIVELSGSVYLEQKVHYMAALIGGG